MPTLTAMPTTNPIQAASPALPTLRHVAMDGQLADDRADERSDDDARQTEKQSEQRAEAGADHRARAGAELLRAERRGGEVDEIAGGANDADDDERPDADVA